MKPQITLTVMNVHYFKAELPLGKDNRKFIAANCKNTFDYVKKSGKINALLRL